MALAKEEQQNQEVATNKDHLMKVVKHDNGPLHVHIEKASVAGPYNMSIYIEGDYCPDHDVASGHGGDNGHNHSVSSHSHGESNIDKAAKSECGSGCLRESFIRLLTTLVPVAGPKRN